MRNYDVYYYSVIPLKNLTLSPLGFRASHQFCTFFFIRFIILFSFAILMVADFQLLSFITIPVIMYGQGQNRSISYEMQ